jgi:phage recombination protein Bet
MATPESTALAVADRDLPEPVSRRGIKEAEWLTLCNNLYPGANPKSVLMVVDYCAARHLDPLKKPVHIVPMEVKVGDSYVWRDVVMPGVYEHRTTAHRTGTYLGHSDPVYGPEIEFAGVKAPEWCSMTMYRLVAGQRAEFPVKVFFREVVATKRDGTANARWKRAPIQMTTKCTEAAGLREAWPEEIGGEMTAEEMDGQHAIDTTVVSSDVVVPDVFLKVPEPMRDNVEKAFALMDLPKGLRLAKLNEFLGASDVDPDLGTQALLNWCRDEYAARQGKTRATGPQNSKVPDGIKTVQQAPSPVVNTAVADTGGDPSRVEKSGARPATVESGKAASGEAPAQQPLKAGDMKWGF